MEIVCGVTQGSILGPLLFLIYINDMFKASNIISTIMFADDTKFFLSHKNIKEMFNLMNTELEKFNIWLKANKLSLNADKTKFTLFQKSSIKENIPLKLPRLKIDNTEIERKDALKFLGILIDENLSWKKHIKTLESKLSCAIGLMYRSRNFLDLNARKLLNFSFVHSHLSYANLTWGATHPTKLEKLSNLQKHACKAVKFKKRKDSALPVIIEMNILTVKNLNIYQTLVLMYRFTEKLLCNFDEFFEKHKKSKYTLRSQTNGNLTSPKNSCKYVEHSLSYRGPNLWNNLPVELKNVSSLNIFKKHVKHYLVLSTC